MASNTIRLPIPPLGIMSCEHQSIPWPVALKFFWNIGYNRYPSLSEFELIVPLDDNDPRFTVQVIVYNKRYRFARFQGKVIVYFFPCHTSKDQVIKEFEEEVAPRIPDDDIIVLFIGINEHNATTNSDNEPELQKPNMKFVEWSVNSSVQKKRQIFQEAVRMAFIAKYINTVRELTQDIYHIEDEDLQIFYEDIANRANIWSINSVSAFYVVICRMFEKTRIDCTFQPRSIWSLNPFYCPRRTFIWRNPSDCSQPSSSDDKPECFVFHANDEDSIKVLLSSTEHPVSIMLLEQNGDWIRDIFTSLKMKVSVRSLVIATNHEFRAYRLDLGFLSSLKALEHLVIVNTPIDVTNLIFPAHLCETIKHLAIRNCNLTEVPPDVGSLIRLRVLNVSENYVRQLPGNLGSLRELHTFLYDHNRIEFPPKNVLKRSAQDVIKYLQCFRYGDETVPHNEAKLIVVGQEGVGKSTLIKGMRRHYWVGDTKPPDKTDGVDITTLKIEETQFLVYDLAGDVEYLNTHPLFLSSQCLHLAVFDMSQFLVDKGTRSADQLCRLELWLQMIAAQHPKSYVIVVGTHADHPRTTKEILPCIRKQIAQLMERYKNSHKEYFDKCMLCNAGMLPDELKGIETKSQDLVSEAGNCIPHVLGYYEVSSIMKYPPTRLSMANTNLEALKSAIASSNLLLTYTEGRISKTWLSFYQGITTEKIERTVPLDDIYTQAEENGVPKEMVESMLRFFHSQGNFLWYEDIQEMRQVIITDPHWLSYQLRTLISYQPSVNAVCDGILHTSSLSTVWKDMKEGNRQKLLILFRSVGLCFSVSDDKELFPCNLPIGWPDREKWPPLPNQDGNQTSLLFTFSFLPTTFFSRLIVEVNNKKRASFPSNVQPLYYRFHILYMSKENVRCDLHFNDSDKRDATPDNFDHKVHYEVMPHRNSLKVSIRGPSPCCLVAGIRSMIEGVQSCYYPGITLQTHLVCPICEMNKDADPTTFPTESSNHENRYCPKSMDNLGDIHNILRGKYKPSTIEETRRIIGKTLEDHSCPKLFIVLPINTECLSFKDRIVYSYFKDGYAVHLLCECPDQWHFVDSPGFRIGKPKEFFEKYGKHLCAVLRAIGKLGTPLRAAAALDPHCKAGAAVASGASSIANELQGFLDNVFDKYPHLKPAYDQDLEDLKTSEGLKRSELAKFLEVVAKGREFGPLVFTYVDKRREWLWLCEEHWRRFAIVKKT